jgi:hypothetical protein
MENMRTKFTQDMITYCVKHINKLSDWEQIFIGSIQSLTTELSSKQYNKLESIFQDLRKREG